MSTNTTLNSPNMPPCSISSPIIGGIKNTGNITIPPGLLGASTNIPITTGTTLNPSWSNSGGGALYVDGNAIVKGTLTVNGQEITKTIDERLAAIEERLNILRVDEKLAKRWEKLGELRRQYLELEQECWEKDEVIRLLKGENA